MSNGAIIGAGIGGSSCAHFIRQDFPIDGGATEGLENVKGTAPKVDIDVYEARNVGGRLATTHYCGKTFEIGGCIIHERNQYMEHFRNYLDLKRKADEESEMTFGFFDGTKFDFTSSRYHYVTLMKMAWRYGFFSLKRLDHFIKKMLDKFDNIYKLQKEGRAFKTVDELFTEVNLTEYFKTNSENGFVEYANINNNILQDLVKGSLRVNYGQDLNVHLFVGSVSVAGMFGKLWAIEGGNFQVPELLIKKSGSTLLSNHRVTKVIYDGDRNVYNVQSIDENGNELTKTYDYVVMAAPLTDDSRMPIQFANTSKPVKVQGKYHRTVATIVSGEVNPTAFNLPASDRTPKLIIDTNSADEICSVSRICDVEKAANGRSGHCDKNVWKIFSKQPLTDGQLSRIFKSHEDPRVFDWLAYPEYVKKSVKGADFVLQPNLFYVNAIEWAASAMEMSAIGGKNVALLVQQAILNSGGGGGQKSLANNEYTTKGVQNAKYANNHHDNDEL